MTKIGNPEAEEAAARVARLLGASKIKTLAVYPLQVAGSAQVDAADLKDGMVDLVIAIGGDGTTLRAFRTIPASVPLISMNVGGHRGVLAEAGAGSIESAVGAMLAGKCFYDSRIRIQASAGSKVFPPALNDILITRTNLTRTPVLSIKLMGDEIKQRMDGIVISTPTGSTGHSFSIGGPVLHEGMSCLILSPIASVNRMPQLVIPVEEIMVTSTHESQLIVDGQEVFQIPAGQTVKVARYASDARFLRLKKKGMRQLAKLGF